MPCGGLTADGHGRTSTLLIGPLVAAAVGTGVGRLSAALINYARIVPFVATLATLGAAGGMSIVLTGGAPIGEGPEDAIPLSVPKVGPFSCPGIAVVVLVIVAGLFLHQGPVRPLHLRHRLERVRRLRRR